MKASKPAGALLRGAALIPLLLLAGGCSTLGAKGPGEKLDPWENWNRKVFSFNESLDANVLKPVATVYRDVIPQPVRRGVDNVFGNVADAWSAINSVLQAKISNGMEDLIRVTTNTLFGVGGLFDVASDLGIERHPEDFGQTLGRWGVGAGAYIVWPLIGPSTMRESIAMPLDLAASPAQLVDDGASYAAISVLQIINARSNLLGATQVIDDIALDKYTFVRDAYLQRRRSLVFDGDAPDLPDDGADDAPPAPAPAK